MIPFLIMILLLVFQLTVSALMFFMVHILKHWKLLLFPRIFQEFDMELSHEDLGVYIIFSYLSFFYGTLVGGLVWGKLSEYLSKHAMIIISMVLMMFFNYLQAINNDFKTFIIFRFLTGFSMNLENFNKSFVHEFFAREYRQKAFFIESASHTLGTLSGPLLGLLVYNASEKFLKSCFIISVVLFVVILLYVVAFMTMDNPQPPVTSRRNSKMTSQDLNEDEENIPFKRWGTIIIPTWREAIIHVFYNNKISRNLILIYLINASIFHVGLVLTTNFLTLSAAKGEYHSDERVLALGNFLGGIGSLFSIYYLSTLDKDPRLYKLYMITTIMVNVIALFVTPFIKYVITAFDPSWHSVIVYGFFIFKEFISFYLYSQLLQHLINVSIHKIYRKALNFVLTIIKAFSHGFFFTFVAPFFYFTVKNPTLQHYRPLNYAFTFWTIAIIQFSTLRLFKYLKLPLEKRSI
jgi:MFS family permease